MIFAIISLGPSSDALIAAISAKFPDNYFHVAPPDGRLFLVSDSGTAKSVSDKLGVTVGGIFGSVVVFGISGYFGVAPVNTWEWIAAKLSAPVPVPQTPAPTPK